MRLVTGIIIGAVAAVAIGSALAQITPNPPTLSSLTQLPAIAGGTVLGNTTTGLATPSALAWTNLPPAPNVLMNSAMEVDQVNEAASVSVPNGAFTYILDGWQAEMTSATGVTTAQRVADAPAGFTNSLKLTVGTGASGVAAGDALQISQPVEANNITDLALGTSSAANLCVSWWVKSSIASYTYGIALLNAPASRAYVSSRTVASSATWTQDGVCFQGDTGGSWVTSGVAAGMTLRFGVAAGATFQGTNNTWNNAAALTGPSPTNTILTTNGATFQIVGAKLEISPVATAYKRQPFWQELTASQRYYVKTFPPGTKPAQSAGVAGSLCNQSAVTTAGTFDALWTFPQIMRASPTIITYNPSAANANIRDVTGASDVAVLVDPATAKSQTSVEIASQTTALVAAHALCIQATADARL